MLLLFSIGMVRGHGATKTDNDQDLSLDTLTNDLKELIESHQSRWKEIILVGHRFKLFILFNQQYGRRRLCKLITKRPSNKYHGMRGIGCCGRDCYRSFSSHEFNSSTRLLYDPLIPVSGF